MTNRSVTLAEILGGLFLGLAVGATGACTAPGGPSSEQNWDWATDAAAATGEAGTLPATSALTCTPARTSLPMPARSSVMSVQTGSSAATVFTEDLFNLFKSNCGGCHVETSLGGFHVSQQTFTQVVDQKAVDHMTSDDPAQYMPPAGAGGMPYSSRTPTDPIVQLATLVKQWIAQGRPDELFTVSSSMNRGGTSNTYMLSPEVGMQLTNLGDCIPTSAIVGTSETTMDQMDVFFAAATELPDTLDQTDLTSFDGTALAQARVIAFAPQYPLWSDGSGKLRHIRVPKGKSVVFDKATQHFAIPPNTRFYKTFLKEVIDGDGSKSYRKIETRLIVARPDKTLSDGTVQPQALFGTYAWNDAETSATLVKLPLRDGTPFADSLIEYTLDEPRAQTILNSMPANLKYALEFASPQLKRHYAIPGGQRCIQCHMGSADADFVLGFIPLQINRLEDGTASAYEDTGVDELTQLQRLIDYGIITGLSSPKDVLPLEQSEAPRKPRNNYELKAQAYMLGNCAHCHNPRGYPSVKNPDLKDVLNFMPGPIAGLPCPTGSSACQTGGVFQFPLGRTSPLRQRGITRDKPIPYITPSLREYPVAQSATPSWTPKWTPNCAISHGDPTVAFLCGTRTDKNPGHLSAPWRSLLYRNVDTPFMYADDSVVFPHMPMNSAGHDCRVATIMGDWMVSIPAKRLNPEIDENAVPGGTKPVDTNAQPYVEVMPGDPDYSKAILAANARLIDYHSSGRYGFCPDTSDIVDPAVVQAGGNIPLVPVSNDIFDPKNPSRLIQPQTGVPNRAHWVVTDITNPPGDWYPRRPDWNTVLVSNMVDTSDLPPDPIAMAAELQARSDVLDALKNVSLTQQLKDFALTETPFGLWQQKPTCNFTAIPKVSDFPGDKRPRWMANTNPTASAPVYMQSPAAAIFSNICINCHGPQADARGLLSDAIMNMTGGTARVADFRDGLFGPVTPPGPGSNRTRVFGAYATGGLTADDWGARYMAWMALGGTRAKIPDAILNIVGTSLIFGASRAHVPAAGSPNMLKLGQALCAQVIPADPNVVGKLDNNFFATGTLDWTNISGLIDTNGDAQMWQHLCSLGNRVLVRAALVIDWTKGATSAVIDPARSLFWGDAYPATSPVLDDRGRVTNGIQPDNLFPLCFQKPTNPQDLALADQSLAANPVGGTGGPIVPYCPDSLINDKTARLAASYDDTVAGGYRLTDATKWATRGAINAGMSVFLYLDQLVRGKVNPKPQYNHCEQLTP